MRAPAAVAAEAVLVGRPGHGLAAERPAEAAVGVAAPGQVRDLTAVHFDQGDVDVVPSAVGHVGGQQVFAVGAPGEALVAVAVRVVDAFEQRLDLAALGRLDHDFRPVTQICHPFSVGRDDRLETGLARLGEELFLRLDGVREEFVVLFGQHRAPDAPASAALGGVVEGASVFGEAHAALLLRRVGDAAGGVVFGRRHENVAADHHRNLLAVGRDGHRRGAAREIHLYQVAFILVADHRDFEFAGLTAFLEHVEVAVLGISQRAVVRHGNVADRIFFVAGQLRSLFRMADTALEEVDGLAALLAQVVERIAVRSPDRLAVFPVVFRELREGAVPVQPDVAGHGRSMMLPERIFISLVVFIENGAVGTDAHLGHRDGSQQLGTAAAFAHGPDLRVAGKTVEMHVRLEIGGKGDAAVGKHRLRRFIAGIIGDAFRRPAFRRYHEYILAAFAIGAEEDLPAVGRPDRVGIVGGIRSQRTRRSALDADDIDVALIGKGDLRSIGRNGVLAKPAGRLLCCDCRRTERSQETEGQKSFHTYRCYCYDRSGR